MLARILFVSAIPLALAHADFQYQSTSKLTGGSLLTMLRFMPGTGSIKEPQISTVAFKGNRMVRRSKRQAEMIDLDKRIITTVNFDKKTYSEMTFEQMKQMLEEASKQASQKQPDANGKQVDLDLNVEVKETGKSKSVNGMDANEFLVTMTMTASDPQSGQSGAVNVTSDTWITKTISGSDEMREFYKRMAKELDWAPTGFGNMLNRPDVAKAMSKMMAEGSKMEGTPVEQIVRMGGAGADGAAATTQSAPKPSLSDALGGALGGRLGIGGLGRKKKDADAQPAADASSGNQSAGVLMEMTVDNSGFSTADVDEALFSFPSDFKKVDEMATQGRRGKN